MCGLSCHEEGLEGQHWYREIASWAAPQGLHRGMTRSCPHTGVDLPGCHGVSNCDQQRQWRPTAAGRVKPLHVTFTHVRMPPAAWLSM